jgi:chromosomal replication initiation ATPase DnaA
MTRRKVSPGSVYGFPGMDRTRRRIHTGSVSERYRRAIRTVIESHYDFSLEELSSETRKTSIKDVRFLEMYFIKKKTRYTLSDIAMMFNRLDHSTVINAVKKIKNRIEVEREYRETVFQPLNEEIDRVYISLIET